MLSSKVQQPTLPPLAWQRIHKSWDDNRVFVCSHALSVHLLPFRGKIPEH
jgi:hypothetical protein